MLELDDDEEDIEDEEDEEDTDDEDELWPKAGVTRAILRNAALAARSFFIGAKGKEVTKRKSVLFQVDDGGGGEELQVFFILFV